MTQEIKTKVYELLNENKFEIRFDSVAQTGSIYGTVYRDTQEVDEEGDIIESEPFQCRIRISDHMSAYGSEEISVSPNEVTPEQLIKSLNRRFEEHCKEHNCTIDEDFERRFF